MKGGKREGAGRKKGSKTQRHVDIALREAARGLTPIEVMLETMRSLWANGQQTEASAIAKDAAPFIHPRLSSVEAKVDVTGHEAALDQLE